MLVILSTACASANNQLELESTPPIVIAYLEGNTILFECLNDGDCFPNIDISDYVKSDISSQHIGLVFHAASSSIFVTLWDSTSFQLLRLNPEIGKVNVVDLPDEINPGFIMIASHDKIILANRIGEDNIWIIKNNLTTEKVSLPLGGQTAGIATLVEVSPSNIIAVNGSLIEEDRKLFAEVFIINTDSGTFTQRLLELTGLQISSGPSEIPQAGSKYAFRVVNVSPDLKQLYVFYYHYETGDKANLTLAMFDTQNLQEIASTKNEQCINLMAGYSQYHNVIYSSRMDTEGNARATLINMSDLTPIVNLSEIIPNEMSRSIIIAPFGDYFLVGTQNSVILISQSGKILKKYTLPQEWMNRDYTIMEYRR